MLIIQRRRLIILEDLLLFSGMRLQQLGEVFPLLVTQEVISLPLHVTRQVGKARDLLEDGLVLDLFLGQRFVLWFFEILNRILFFGHSDNCPQLLN